MLYCIEVKRGGIGEEDFNMHQNFDKEPTRDEVVKIVEAEDCGYDDKYCSVDFYAVG